MIRYSLICRDDRAFVASALCLPRRVTAVRLNRRRPGSARRSPPRRRSRRRRREASADASRTSAVVNLPTTLPLPCTRATLPDASIQRQPGRRRQLRRCTPACCSARRRREHRFEYRFGVLRTSRRSCERRASARRCTFAKYDGWRQGGRALSISPIVSSKGTRTWRDQARRRPQAFLRGGAVVLADDRGTGQVVVMPMWCTTRRAQRSGIVTPASAWRRSASCRSPTSLGEVTPRIGGEVLRSRIAFAIEERVGAHDSP